MFYYETNERKRDESMEEDLREEAIRRILKMTEEQAEQLLRRLLESGRACPEASGALSRPSS